MPIQGYITFPGIRGIIRANCTLGTGISPSAVAITLVPQRGITILIGPLIWIYGNTRIVFRNARIDKASIQVNQGGYIESLTILDRRWRWADGWISKFYNIRYKSTTGIIPETKATPQQMAKDFLFEMGEARYNVGSMPSNLNIEMKLKAHNPAQALQKLANDVGCRIIYDPINDRIDVRPKGQNSAIPSTRIVQEGAGVNIKPLPSHIDLIFNETEYEFRWSTRAVGLDTDEEIKPIDDLSYTPSNGWGKESPKGMHNVRFEHGKKAHSYAQKSVFKWYEITKALKKPVAATATTWIDPVGDEQLRYRDNNGTIFKLVEWDFELFDHMILKDLATNRRREIELYGSYWDGNFNFTNTVIMTPLDVDSSLDKKRAIVKLNKPLVFLETTGNSFTNRPAIVYVQLMGKWAPNYPQPPLRHLLRYTLGGPGLAFAIKEPALKLQVVGVYGNTGQFLNVVTNNVTLGVEANKLFVANLEQFQPVSSRNIRYEGLRKVSPSGSVLQVGWQVGPDGAFTTVGVNSTWDLILDIDEDTAAAFERELTQDILNEWLIDIDEHLADEKSKKSQP